MDISEEISKMNFYKTFEPYIDPSVTMEERMKGGCAPHEGCSGRGKAGPCQMEGHETEEPDILRAGLSVELREWNAGLRQSRRTLTQLSSL